MFNTALARAVEQFAAVTQGLPDAELDRAWAWGAYDSEGVRFALFRTYEELRELAVKLAAQRSDQGPARSEAQRILAHYHAAYRDLQAVLLAIGPDEADRAPAEEQWSLRRIAAHIVGAEAGFYVVVKYALDRQRSEDDRPAKIPDEVWETLLGDEASFVAILEGPLAGIQSYHAKLHERVLGEFATINAAELAAPSMYWEGYEMSLRFRLHRFDSHLRQHTVQVDKTLAGIDHPPRESKRLLRLVYAALAEAEGATIGAWELGAALHQEAAEAISTRADEVARALS
jgi:hypothetical protein